MFNLSTFAIHPSTQLLCYDPLESELDEIIVKKVARRCNEALHTTGDARLGAQLWEAGDPTAFAAVCAQNHFRGLLGQRLVSGTRTSYGGTVVNILGCPETLLFGTGSGLADFYTVDSADWDKLANQLLEGERWAKLTEIDVSVGLGRASQVTTPWTPSSSAESGRGWR